MMLPPHVKAARDRAKALRPAEKRKAAERAAARAQKSGKGEAPPRPISERPS